MSRTLKLLSVILFVLTPAWTAAQGVLIDGREDHAFRLPRLGVGMPRPAPETSYRIKELDIQIALQDQIARTQVSQTFVNTGSRQMEVSFVFPLPYDGAIDRMTFMVDGKEFDANLLSAAEARRVYEGYVRRNQDPALLEWFGTGMFKTSVFPVPPGASRTVTLKFSQICRQHAGITELLFPLSTAKYTAQPVERIGIRVSVQSQAKIKNVYSPTHTVEIKRPTDNAATVSYSFVNEIPATDFRLLYDAGDKPVGASIVSYKPRDGEDGFFVLLASPEVKRSPDKPLAKAIVFVVDRSGSMTGKKFEQAKGAMRFVLNNLRPGDLFNIVAYDSSVESFRPELQKFDDATRAAALGFVEGLYAGGSTNIDGALQAALAQLQDDSRPNYVVFLTDGLPTAGERNEPRIAANAKQNNKVKARVFSFGVGYDVNSRLLDKLSRACFGQSQYVRPDDDIEAHVSQLYTRIGAPAMTDVKITLDVEDFPAERGSLANRIYPREVYDLFAGDQLVLVGRYQQGGDAKLTIRGSIDGTPHAFHFPAKLATKSGDETFAFAEKLWAMRRVGEIIDEIDLSGKNQELVDELVALATKHGILTPYTSFLADENASPLDVAANRRQAGIALDQLHLAEGVGGFVQRDIKNQLQRSSNAAPSSGGGGFGGGAGGMPGASGIRGRGAMPALRTLEDKAIEVTNVRQAGGKTFYFRNKQWVDSSLSAEKQKSAKKIERFSAEYFELLAKHAELGKYATSDEEVIVMIGDQAYAF